MGNDGNGTKDPVGKEESNDESQFITN